MTSETEIPVSLQDSFIGRRGRGGHPGSGAGFRRRHGQFKGGLKGFLCGVSRAVWAVFGTEAAYG
jgi:hypothetical protein